MNNKKALAFGLSGLLLISCATRPSFDSETSDEQSTTSLTSVERDENGFPILPDGYLAPETREHSFAPVIPGMPIYNRMKLFLGDEEVPVYRVYTNVTHRWDPAASNRMENGVASITISEGAKLNLQTNWTINGHYEITPKSANIPAKVDENHRMVSFEINKPGDYVIEFRNDRVLHLFVHSPDEGASLQPTRTFGPGIHTGTYNLSSNEVVYIADGAVVRGRFQADHASNITICGPGFVDGSTYDRNASAGTAFIPFDFNYCTNIKFLNFAVLDPAGWCFNLYFSKYIELDGIKIISSRSNGDGISLQSCEHAEVHNCFVRTYDDSIVVKNYPQWNNRNNEGTTDDINVHHCLIWTDLAQSMEIGYETVGTKMENIRFHDMTILHADHEAAISIHNANNANIKNVSFENIVIEKLWTGQGDGDPYLLEFTVAHSATWSDQHKVTSLGSIDGVLVKNIQVLQGINTPLISIRGSYETRAAYPNILHTITNVTLEDIIIKGVKINETYSGINIVLASQITLDGKVLA